jgi:predicted RNA-binding Zn ribbon-like protein
MLNDASRAQGSAIDARQCVEQCLKSVLTLTPAELRNPELRSALTSLQLTVQKLLAVDVSERPEVKSSAQTSARVQEPQDDFDASDFAESADGREHSAKPWRTRIKSSAEKQEKKARLEKREAILRDLRTRVSQFRDEQAGHETFNENKSESAASMSFETFEMRRHRASFWPEGSSDWARQLLGVELWMSHAEKRQRYVEMVRICHPDHNKSVPPEAIQLVNAAWEVIRQQGVEQ